MFLAQNSPLLFAKKDNNICSPKKQNPISSNDRIGFKRFKKILRQADKLIMIGYGCKDNGINEIIKEDFGYQHKPSFIVDKYAEDMVVEFGKEIKTVLHKTILYLQLVVCQRFLVKTIEK